MSPHQDHLGSTSVITDESGDAVYEASYDPWGNVRASTGTADIDRLYTGQRFDSATGLYYYNARYCDPTLARFISPDTIVPGVGDPQAWNRYAYALGNPLRYTDPSGNKHRTINDSLKDNEEYQALRPGSAKAVNIFLGVSRAINYEHRMKKKHGGTLTPVDAKSSIGSLTTQPRPVGSNGPMILDSRNRTAIQLEGGEVIVDPGTDSAHTVRLLQGEVLGGSQAWVPNGDEIVSESAPGLMSVGLLMHEAEHVRERRDSILPDKAWSWRYAVEKHLFKIPREARATNVWNWDPISPRTFWVLMN